MDQSMWRSRMRSRTKSTLRGLGTVWRVQWTFSIHSVYLLKSQSENKKLSWCVWIVVKLQTLNCILLFMCRWLPKPRTPKMFMNWPSPKRNLRGKKQIKKTSIVASLSTDRYVLCNAVCTKTYWASPFEICAPPVKGTEKVAYRGIVNYTGKLYHWG